MRRPLDTRHGAGNPRHRTLGHRLYGARPMARLIQSKVKEPMAEEILFGKLQNGGRVLITEKEGELELQFTGSDK